MEIVAISDTHGMHRKLHVPDGDVLIHSGDLLNHGTLAELEDFAEWLEGQPHREKIIVAGNHDWICEERPLTTSQIISDVGGTYLENDWTVVDGVKIYGSPFSPTFGKWSFMADRGFPIAKVWSEIPLDTDILITHGPPASILDSVKGDGPQGCADLLKRVRLVQPKVHIFGHIHEHGGRQEEHEGTLFVNASVLDGRYHMNYKAQVVSI